MQEAIDAVIVSINRYAMKAYLYSKRNNSYKTIDAFDRQLWNAALSFYRGDTDAFGFIDDMTSSIETQINKAWREGMKEMGADPADITDGEQFQLDGVIANENEYILNLAQDIEDARLAKIKLLSDNTDKDKINSINTEALDKFRSTFRPRIDMWVNRYRETKNRAIQQYADKGQKLKWVLGPTEKHCHSGDVTGKIGCADLDGIVLYSKEWEQIGVLPNEADSKILACGGWRCECKLEPTTERRTSSGLTKILDMITAENV